MSNAGRATLLGMFRLASGACAATQVGARPPLTPEAAFAGRTEGHGTLRILLGRARSYRVRSLGTIQADGRFRLDQAVEFGDKPSEDRRWDIVQSSPLHYSGTLSDAAGHVTGETQGGRLTLRYRLKGPLVMHQKLELGADGTTIDNAGRITLFGIPVGRLHETIERKDR
jgi:hypothetical protein